MAPYYGNTLTKKHGKSFNEMPIFLWQQASQYVMLVKHIEIYCSLPPIIPLDETCQEHTHTLSLSLSPYLQCHQVCPPHLTEVRHCPLATGLSTQSGMPTPMIPKHQTVFWKATRTLTYISALCNTSIWQDCQAGKKTAAGRKKHMDSRVQLPRKESQQCDTNSFTTNTNCPQLKWFINILHAVKRLINQSTSQPRSPSAKSFSELEAPPDRRIWRVSAAIEHASTPFWTSDKASWGFKASVFFANARWKSWK